MNKKCSLFREILFQCRTRGTIKFTQKDLAQSLGISVSTVFHALRKAREANIVRVTGRFFVVEDYKKLLYLLATERNLSKDIIYKTFIDEKPANIEALMPPQIAFGLYSAARFLLPATPAEYDHVYIYASKENLNEVFKRIHPSMSTLEKKNKHTSPNVFVIEMDSFFSRYPQPLFEQIFIDIWNAPEWYAKDFLKTLEETISL